jgi:beta-glucosidase-like glycosyl hydrolase
MLRPFKAVIDLGGARGVMMAYSELDAIPSHIDPFLYDQLEEWEFDGFVTADDAGMKMLEGRHRVADSPAGAVAQWFNAGGLSALFEREFWLLIRSRWYDSVLRLSSRGLS